MLDLYLKESRSHTNLTRSSRMRLPGFGARGTSSCAGCSRRRPLHIPAVTARTTANIAAADTMPMSGWSVPAAAGRKNTVSKAGKIAAKISRLNGAVLAFARQKCTGTDDTSDIF